jgi:hypothetical protein
LGNFQPATLRPMNGRRHYQNASLDSASQLADATILALPQGLKFK